jgi:hypothetical protein
MVRWTSPERIDAQRLAKDPALARRLLFCNDPQPLVVTGLIEQWPEALQQVCWVALAAAVASP